MGVEFQQRICYGMPLDSVERKPALIRLKITQIDWQAFEDLEGGLLPAACLFVQPFWLRTVVRHLGAPGEPLLLAAWDGNALVGLAPLAVAGDTVHFLGSPEVCDYQDVLVVPGRETDLLPAIAEHLKTLGIRRMVLQCLRPESAALKAVTALTARGTLRAVQMPAGVSFEAALPASWEAYLAGLDGKQRHEVRRKQRRLEGVGPFDFRQAEWREGIIPDMAVFLDLFARNRADKAAFMTPAMKAYFQDLAANLAARRMLRLYTLAVRGEAAAAVLCFDHRDVRYLYNSAYDRRFEELSVGVMCKLLSIQAAIASGCRRYDLLKGAEAYKKRIGGTEVPLVRCDVALG